MFKIVQFISFGKRLRNSCHRFGKKVASSACHLFILWLLNCIVLSLSLMMGLDVDLTVPVPEFTYSLCLK